MSEKRHAILGLHADHETGPSRKIYRTRTLRRVKIVALLALALLLIGALIALGVRRAQSSALAEAADMQKKQYVLTVKASTDAKSETLALPGTLQGYIEAPISARTTGYLIRWTKDIGSRVKKGDLLAEISTPEIDQQLAQAVAARPQLVSALELAKTTLQRWGSLLRDRAVSQQEYDERRSAYTQAEANLAAADANIRRLKEMEAFKHVVAPFSGIITRRNVNIGDLIEAGGGTSRPLFLLTQPDPLRVYIYVPQVYANKVKTGQVVAITQAELPGQSFDGKIVRTAGAIDIANRSLQAEISLPNPGGKLLPGSYVSVSLPFGASDAITIPTNALLLRSEGPRVAVIDKEGKVHLHAVSLGKDFGLKVQVLDGISPSDVLVLNPSDSLAEGDVVVVAERNAPTKF
ncbi:MAG TPA: efflux RND transporter periplasmic adaptor subunit [Noviherbaspirillum sp.]|nr:efflux RND transporter periplasmic adaptor subunit [Noviherbaspirillum sp.]